MPKIYIIDVTNRDGVQTSRICLSKFQKTVLNLYLSQMGVFGKMRLGGWIRAIEEDVELAFMNVSENSPKL